LLLVSVIATSAIWYVWAATPTTTFWVSPGIYPGAPTYTIWKEGSNYFAKDANGQIDYSGTNASDVIQDSIDATSRGNIYLYGPITLTTQVKPKDDVGLIGDTYGTVITLATDICGINITNVQNVLIRDLLIDVTVSSYSESVIFIGGNSRSITLENLYVKGKNDYSGVGIKLQPGDNGIYRSSFNEITTYYFANAFLLSTDGTSTGWINSNGFYHIYCWLPLVGIQFSTDGASQDIGYNIFSHIEMQADASLQVGININETVGDIHYNKFYGVTIFDVPATKHSIFIGASLNDFFGVDAYSQINGSLIYGSNIFSSGWFKLRYINPEPNPTTEGWGLMDRGLMWYCGEHDCMEYWNGTHIIYWNATGTGVQP